MEVLSVYCYRFATKKEETRYQSGFYSSFSREDRIRTCDHMTPSHVRYRAALLPELFTKHRCLVNIVLFPVS
jgi:hypothetical protein